MTNVHFAGPQRIVRRYGLGSLLAVLSLPIAMVMAALGMNGWQQSAIRAMERDAIKLQQAGYLIAATQGHSLPLVGIVYYVVTYERRP